MKKAIVFSLVALLLNSASPFLFAQTLRAASAKDFDAAYDAQVRKTLSTFPDLPGIAIVVVKDDRPIFVHAYGMADKEAGIKADSDTLFYTGSSTKSFTALAAAMLDQEGKIYHHGGYPGYRSHVSFMPERKIAGSRFREATTGHSHGL